MWPWGWEIGASPGPPCHLDPCYTLRALLFWSCLELGDCDLPDQLGEHRQIPQSPWSYFLLCKLRSVGSMISNSVIPHNYCLIKTSTPPQYLSVESLASEVRKPWFQIPTLPHYLDPPSYVQPLRAVASSSVNCTSQSCFPHFSELNEIIHVECFAWELV